MGGRGSGSILGDPGKLDNDWRKQGWDVDHLERNYYTPEAFEASVRRALKVSDEYVWIYTEKPKWWSESGKPVDLPEAYIEAVRAARQIK